MPQSRRLRALLAAAGAPLLAAALTAAPAMAATSGPIEIRLSGGLELAGSPPAGGSLVGTWTGAGYRFTGTAAKVAGVGCAADGADIVCAAATRTAALNADVQTPAPVPSDTRPLALDLSLAADLLTGGAIVSLGAGDDRFSAAGASYTTEVHAGPGHDTLRGGSSLDLLDGGSGNDTFLAGPAADGADHYTGGGSAPVAGDPKQSDTVSYAARSAAVTATLPSPGGQTTTNGAPGEQDRLDDIHAVIGGSGDDTLGASSGTAYLAGGPGRDQITGGSGDDLIDIRRPLAPRNSTDGDQATDCGGGNDLIRRDADDWISNCERDAPGFVRDPGLQIGAAPGGRLLGEVWDDGPWASPALNPGESLVYRATTAETFGTVTDERQQHYVCVGSDCQIPDARTFAELVTRYPGYHVHLAVTISGPHGSETRTTPSAVLPGSLPPGVTPPPTPAPDPGLKLGAGFTTVQTGKLLTIAKTIPVTSGSATVYEVLKTMTLPTAKFTAVLPPLNATININSLAKIPLAGGAVIPTATGLHLTFVTSGNLTLNGTRLATRAGLQPASRRATGRTLALAPRTTAIKRGSARGLTVQLTKAQLRALRKAGGARLKLKIRVGRQSASGKRWVGRTATITRSYPVTTAR